MGHALLVLALIELEFLSLLLERLPQPHHVAVAGQHHHAADKAVLRAVKAHVLVFQKAYQRLRHCEPNRLHFVNSSGEKMCSLASGFHIHACSGSSMRVFFHGSPGRCRMPQT